MCISILHDPGEDKFGYERPEERWLPIHTVETILVSVISMLADPNDESPANLDAAVRMNLHSLFVPDRRGPMLDGGVLLFACFVFHFLKASSVCRFPSLSAAFRRFPSLSAAFRRFPPLSVAFRRFPSLSMNFSSCDKLKK